MRNYINRIYVILTAELSGEYSITHIQQDINPIEIAAPGTVLNIMYLLPNLSMKNVATKLPRALVHAKGIFKITPSYSLSLTPSIVRPVLIITYGP